MRRIVRGHADRHAIADDYADIETLHFAAEFCGDLNAVFQGDDILAAPRCIGDLSFKTGEVFF